MGTILFFFWDGFSGTQVAPEVIDEFYSIPFRGEVFKPVERGEVFVPKARGEVFRVGDR